jgi:hypothetical protein
MIAICRATSRNVKRWQNGDVRLRWTAAGMLQAERRFCKIIDLQARMHDAPRGAAAVHLDQLVADVSDALREHRHEPLTFA